MFGEVFVVVWALVWLVGVIAFGVVLVKGLDR